MTFKTTALEKRNWTMVKIAEEKYDHLMIKIINSCTTSDILEELTTLIFDKAILDPTFCPMYAKLCSDICDKLPTFQPTEPGARIVSFKKVLYNLCQSVFEGAEEIKELRVYPSDQKEKEMMLKLQTLGNIRFIGELRNQKVMLERIAHHIIVVLLGADEKICPPEENVEALCLFLKTIGKKPLRSKWINYAYLSHLKTVSNHPQLVTPQKYMIWETINYLRFNGWP
ncbi:eukaryotic translation initiation factor isoform X1 [Raphanus sativus]|uniref:Eukaryotic translation initiation factor isoform X1 n=1 Tax=Raphanus sativus TaxID=3726 RepID=A0A9W3D9N0_RAPSA|nr:eukaryotic translation initiation factor isoform X1 [Raphanus sativus]